jgi:hypothetical protein
MKCFYHPSEEAVAFCQSCGKGICQNCNVDIETISFCKRCVKSGRTETYTTQKQPRNQSEILLKRPRGITLISIFWAFAAPYNLFVGSSILLVDSQLLFFYWSSLSFPEWARWAVPFDIILGIIVLSMGMAQFATIYGFWKRKNWSYRSGIIIPLTAIIASYSQFLLYSAVPASSDSGANLTYPITSTVSAIIILWYLRRGITKTWLRKS